MCLPPNKKCRSGTLGRLLLRIAAENAGPLMSSANGTCLQGTVIKTNNNQRYATNAETGFMLRELARRAEVPVQVVTKIKHSY